MYKLIISLMVTLAYAPVMSADLNEPYDFSYTVDGRNYRPVTVFNDGETTYIQPRDKQQLLIDGQNVSMRGPYYIIKGVPETIVGYSGGETFKIVWQGSKRTAITDETSRKNGDLAERTFSGTFGRIAFVNGVPPDVGLVNPLPKSLQLKEAMKALAPHGWSGAADKSINTTQTISIESSKGESWIAVLDRLMTSQNIWIEIDTGKKSLFLRDTPPKGFSVVLEANSQPRAPATVTGVSHSPIVAISDRPDLDKKPTTASASQSPQDSLLSMVNVRQIQQKNGQTIVSLLNSGMPMRFYNLETGEALSPSKITPVDLAFPLLPMLRIQAEGGTAIDVKRIFKHVANFTPNNPIGLKNVGEADGLTVFSFASPLPKLVAVAADNRTMNGTWSANQFIVQGTSPEWKLSTQETALAVDIEDKGVYVWKRSSAQ